MSAVAAAERELGFTGGGITACLGDNKSGVVNILSLDGGREPAFGFPPPRGLFMMESRTALRGGVLARCAMMVLVLDLVTMLELRIFARELAVGANNLVEILVGLKMDALLRLSSLLFLLLLLLLVPSAAVAFVPLDDAALTEARIF